jgi:AcrR family transcriptional regulator
MAQAAAARAPGKRERNKLANRTAILQAAQQCFLDEGYEAITIRDVVRRSGLAAGTFYNYFETKEEVFRALLEERFAHLTQALSEIRRRARSLEEFIHGAYGLAFSTIAADPAFFRLLFRNEPVVRALYSDSVMGLSLRALKSDIYDAIQRGIFPDMDVEFLASAFFGAGFEIGRQLVEGARRNPEEAAAFATRLFIGGIQAFSRPDVPLKPRVRAAL